MHNKLFASAHSDALSRVSTVTKALHREPLLEHTPQVSGHFSCIFFFEHLSFNLVGQFVFQSMHLSHRLQLMRHFLFTFCLLHLPFHFVSHLASLSLQGGTGAGVGAAGEGVGLGLGLGGAGVGDDGPWTHS